jgi:hypothetical protein
MSGKGSKQRPTDKSKFDVNYDRIFGKEKNDRVVRTLAENSKNKSMTRKVDTYEYETLEECIKSEQVPPAEIAEIFTDKEYYKWYAKRNFK